MKLNKIIDIVNEEFGVDIRENKEICNICMR